MVALHLPVTAEEIRPRRRTADRRRDLIASDFLCLGVAVANMAIILWKRYDRYILHGSRC